MKDAGDFLAQQRALSRANAAPSIKVRLINVAMYCVKCDSE